MLARCFNFAKTLYAPKVSPSHRPQSAMSKANVIAWPDSEDSNLAARYLQLARKIHAYFTNQEEKQAAVRRAAENLATKTIHAHRAAPETIS